MLASTVCENFPNIKMKHEKFVGPFGEIFMQDTNCRLADFNVYIVQATTTAATTNDNKIYPFINTYISSGDCQTTLDGVKLSSCLVGLMLLKIFEKKKKNSILWTIFKFWIFGKNFDFFDTFF